MIMAAMIRITASGSVIRAPYSTRENTSRPSSSVPNQCAADGGARMAKFCASGLSGAISGAKIAITTQAPITPRPGQGQRAAPRHRGHRAQPPAPRHGRDRVACESRVGSAADVVTRA